MKRTELDADTLAAAARLIRGGIAPETVIKFIYQIGYLNGGTDMAESELDAIKQAQKVAA
jgi:hypothetical protein